MSVVEQKDTHNKMDNVMISSVKEPSKKSKDPVMAAWKYFIELNFFSTVSSLDDPHELETERIATKVFLGILLVLFLILFSYTTAATSVHTFTINSPSLEQYKSLYRKYSQTLKCPCSQISNKYESFITIEYSRHPVCLSTYIKDEWIAYIGNYYGVMWRYDFRFLARQIFQALRLLCQLTGESIEISLEQFYLNYHVTDVVIDEELLQSQLEAIIEQFTATSMNKFLLSLRMIGNTTRANALLSGLFTNAYLYRGSGSYIETQWNYFGSCSCSRFSICLADSIMFKNGSSSFTWTLPGVYRSCLILEGLLQSDLRCFFNQTCLDDFQVHLEVGTPLDLTHLNSSNLHRFDATTTIGAIVDRLMIDEWHWNINHSRYYDMCQPRQCVYRVVSGNSWIFIIGTLVGLVGGLVTALKLIVPRTIRIARWRFRRNTENSLDGSAINRLTTLFKKLLQYISEWNLFPSMPASNDPQKLQTERISTRVFFVAFLMSSYILFIYTATQTSIHPFTIDFPSLERYNQLLQQYSQSLKCPCSQISNNYQSFVAIEYSQHPVCSSVYITDQWITALLLIYETFAVTDFRYLGHQMFTALRSLCQLTQESIKIGLHQFYSSHYVTDVVSNEELLRLQADASIQYFIESTTNNFLLSMRMISNTSQANALASHLLTNYWFIAHNVSTYLNSMFLTYDDNCVCSISSTCVSNVFIDRANLWRSPWHVPGFYRGCFILEALRRSDLRCFYDQYCLADLINNLGINQSVFYTVLDVSSLKRFQEDTQIGTVLDALMVDQWRWNVSHAKYYKMCQPQECAYTIVTRNSWISILTVMIGLVGGLVTALRVAVPQIVQTIRSLTIKKTRRRLEQIQEQSRRTFKDAFLQYFNELNLFPSIQSTADIQTLRTERIATKVFLITFFISFIILLVYTATTTVTHSFIISNSSLAQYNQLYQNHPQTLTCTCSQITNKYQSFIDIQYTLHPICSSVYTTDRWIIYEWFSSQTLFTADFRLQGTRMFLALQSFCQLAEMSIKIALEQFYANNYITAVVTHPDLLQSQLHAIIQQFITTTTNNFLLQLRLIGNTTQANALASATFSNINFHMQFTSSWVDSDWLFYDNNCSCAYDSRCSSKAAIYTNGEGWAIWNVPGFYRGCFILEALRKSDLRCFTNETCLQDLRAHLEFTQSISLPILNLSSSRNFHGSTPIGVIMDALMVDEWKWVVSHAKYYAVCQPKECNYIVVGKNNLVGLITTLIGILGGLVKIEQFLIPKMTSFVVGYIQRKRNATIHPLNTTTATIPSVSDGLKVENIDS